MKVFLEATEAHGFYYYDQLFLVSVYRHITINYFRILIISFTWGLVQHPRKSIWTMHATQDVLEVRCLERLELQGKRMEEVSKRMEHLEDSNKSLGDATAGHSCMVCGQMALMSID